LDQSLRKHGRISRLLSRARASAIVTRFASGAFANLVDKSAFLLVQLGTISTLTHYWGAETYGTWVVLMTIPAYLAAGDLGLSTAAQVDLTHKVMDGDKAGALQTFHSAWALMSAIMAAVLALVGAYTLLATVGPLKDPSDGVTIPVMVFLAAAFAVLQVQSGLLIAGFRATHKYALGMYITAGMLLAQGLAIVATAALGGSLIEAGLAQLAVRLGGFVMLYLVLRRFEPWMVLGVGHASLATVKRLLRPSLAAFSLTLATSLSLQGMVGVVGFVAGPAAAAVFASARFLSRIPLQFAGLVTRASIPELTRTQSGGADQKVTRAIVWVNVGAALVSTAPFVLALWLLGPDLLSWMSHHELRGDAMLFFFLSLAAMLSAVSDAVATPLVASNRQAAYSYWYGLLTAMGLLVPFCAGAWGLTAAAITTAVVESLGLTIIVLRLRALRTSDHGG